MDEYLAAITITDKNTQVKTMHKILKTIYFYSLYEQ